VNPVLRTPQLWLRAFLVLDVVLGYIAGSYSMTYLTTITSCLALIYLIVGLWWMWTRRTAEPLAPRLRLGLTTWLVFVGIVAHVLLEHGVLPFAAFGGPDWDAARESFTKLAIHYVLPLGMLVDWLAFGPRRRSRWLDLWWIAAVPTFYGLVTVARAIVFPQIQDRIPYPFMEPGADGFGPVILTLLPMVVAIAALGALLLGADRLLARLSPRRY